MEIRYFSEVNRENKETVQSVIDETEAALRDGTPGPITIYRDVADEIFAVRRCSLVKKSQALQITVIQ